MLESTNNYFRREEKSSFYTSTGNYSNAIPYYSTNEETFYNFIAKINEII